MQLIEEAVNFPNPYGNSTACLIPIFDPMMTVLREQWSYPIISLVADTGGILGLFIGFNFLMAWDLMKCCCRQAYNYCFQLYK